MPQTPADLLRQLFQTALAAAEEEGAGRLRGDKMLAATAAMARDMGLEPLLLPPDTADGPVEAGQAHADLARATPPGTLILFGGPTATGRRHSGAAQPMEYLLSLGLGLAGARDIWALAGGADASGAILAPDSLERATAAGLDPAQLLAGDGAGQLFDTLGDLVPPGPQQAKVRDFRAILVL